MKKLCLLALLTVPGWTVPITIKAYPPGAQVFWRNSSIHNESYLGLANVPIEFPDTVAGTSLSQWEIVVRHPDGQHLDDPEVVKRGEPQWPPTGEIRLAPRSSWVYAYDLIRYPTALTGVLAGALGGVAVLAVGLKLRHHRALAQQQLERQRTLAARRLALREAEQLDQQKQLHSKEQEVQRLRDLAIQRNQGRDPWIGSSVGLYAAMELLGRGASGRVYRGQLLKEHPTAPEAVAMKIIETDHGVDEVMRKRFSAEADLGKSFDHPNIVKYYAKADTPRAICIFLELIEGGRTLKDLSGPRPIQEVCQLLAPVAKALDYMHGLGCFHRDLKPENIMLTKQGVPKIADLGLAKNPDVSRLTRTSEAFGTLAYVAPEQLMDTKTVDGKADQYALGCIAYEMLSGRLPFDTDDPNQLIMGHLQLTPEPLQIVEEPVNKVLLTMLAKDRNQRFATASEAIQALQKASLFGNT